MSELTAKELLAAAAPELLEAVKAFIEWFDGPDANPTGREKITAMFKSEINLARRALRKVNTGLPED